MKTALAWKKRSVRPGFRTTETHGRSFYGYIRPPGSPDRPIESIEMRIFFSNRPRVTPRRETVVRDRVVNLGHRPIMYARSRRVGDSDERSAISRATYHAGSKSVRRRDSPLLRALLLRSAPAFFSTFLDGRLFFFGPAVSPFIEAVYRSVRLVRLGSTFVRPFA